MSIVSLGLIFAAMCLVGAACALINFFCGARNAFTTGELSLWLVARHLLFGFLYIVGGVGAVTCLVIWIVKTL